MKHTILTFFFFIIMQSYTMRFVSLKSCVNNTVICRDLNSDFNLILSLNYKCKKWDNILRKLFKNSNSHLNVEILAFIAWAQYKLIRYWDNNLTLKRNCKLVYRTLNSLHCTISNRIGFLWDQIFMNFYAPD